MLQTNSKYVRWFIEIERELSSLFKLFSPLCAQCFTRSQEQVAEHKRDQREFWCCCLTDNQVHDHWETLDAIQKREDPRWYQKLTASAPVVEGRMPGNGPCPAISQDGCLIKKCRPITCSTQICEKMLHVLNKSGVCKQRGTGPLQIEEIVDLPDILPELCGHRRSKQVTEQEVRQYKASVGQLKQALQAIPEEQRKRLITEALETFLGGGK